MKITFAPCTARHHSLNALLKPGNYVFVDAVCGRDAAPRRGVFRIIARAQGGAVSARYCQNATSRLPGGSKLTTRRRFEIPVSAIRHSCTPDEFQAAYSAEVSVPEQFARLSANQRRIVAHVVGRLLGGESDLDHPADVCRVLRDADIESFHIDADEVWVAVESAARELMCHDVSTLLPGALIEQRMYSPPSDEGDSDAMHVFARTPQCALSLYASYGGYCDEEHDGYATAAISFASARSHASKVEEYRRKVVDEAISDAVFALRALEPADRPIATQVLSTYLAGA